MLLTNNQNNTMRQYCGELPGMTHVQSKPEKLKFQRLLITPPVQNTCLEMYIELVKLSTSLLNGSLSLSLSLCLSLSAFYFLYQD